jgi:hypothetical protein
LCLSLDLFLEALSTATTILRMILYGCERLSFASRKGQKLMMTDRKMLKRMLG